MFDRKEYDLKMQQARKDQVDFLAEYLAGYIKKTSEMREMKITHEEDPQIMKELDALPIPAAGRNVREVANELVDKVLSQGMLVQHPKFFSFVSSAVSPYSLAGAVLTDIYNPHGGGWEEAPAACLIEEKIVKWMARRAGYPLDTCGGVFLSGGSMSNMTALIAARDKILGEENYPIGTAYISDQTHSSVSKGLRLIGMRKDQIVTIPTDDEFKMRTDLLEEAIVRDIASGKKPFVVIGTLGTTNTGAIDPLNDIGDICRKYGLWFHIDGAYGASILISDIFRGLASGIEKSDSFSWDAHKWALQTYSCSMVAVKDKNDLLSSFSEHPEYLEDLKNDEHNDAWDLGPEMTRPHRALKLWFTLQAMGTDQLADVIDYAFFNAKEAEKRLRAYEGWEIVSRPSCGALTFRYVPKGWSEERLDALAGAISERINRDGFAFIVTTTVKNKRVLRMCLINGNTTDEDVIETIDYLNEIAVEISSKAR